MTHARNRRITGAVGSQLLRSTRDPCEFDDGVVADVADDAAGLDEVDFVDAHPLRRLEPEFGFQLVDVVPEGACRGSAGRG